MHNEHWLTGIPRPRLARSAHRGRMKLLRGYVSKSSAVLNRLTITQLAEVDPMYQYSLKDFSQLFNSCIEQSEPSSDLDIGLSTLLKNITSSVYTNVARYAHMILLCTVNLTDDKRVN